MSRIIAGTLGGRIIQVPVRGTRPTSDRVRESLFARLEHWDVVRNARVADLFAGSGALAFEALSRGAQHADLVDSARGAITTIRANVSALGLAERTQVVAVKAERFAANYVGVGWDLVLIDPPYDVTDVSINELLTTVTPHIRPGGIVVVERDKHSAEPAWPAPIVLIESKVYGSTVLHYAENPTGTGA
ncbi:16S rRNA (guanine(966)-N(2))-methyltransferase RsmD [Rarobacter faecitabidus]|uniref:16S rRNA (Guanine966-N2)-methyltransferase n=1 Tax=Rarobacter faecitabidus TaxID=13243 RepID=A0A542ZUR5_RARFA|nr:16S rRNA (guanine(966)-N(2))-methyltransferase RsmD [Rarobacter faecitabidus]TQL64082.1 16S rRNA (guanine966-N2)-methyltransferase [Rarobacter faecitabidus]